MNEECIIDEYSEQLKDYAVNAIQSHEHPRRKGLKMVKQAAKEIVGSRSLDHAYTVLVIWVDILETAFDTEVNNDNYSDQ